MTQDKLLPSRLARLQPGLAAFAVLAMGFVMVAVSFFWHFGSTTASNVTRGGTEVIKEVGYGSAFNWSVGLTLLLPAAILYLCKAYDAFIRVVRDLAERGMALSKTLDPVPTDELRGEWTKILDSRRKWLMVLVLVGTLFSLWEWWESSAGPLWANQVKQAKEWDWSVGAMLDDSGESQSAPTGARFRNGLLSLLAFLGQSLIIAVILTFVYQTILASAFFTRLASPDGPYRLIPNAKSQDPRRGFEGLSDFLEYSLILVAILYFQFYLSRIQNIYLRSDAENILSFVHRDLVKGLLTNPLDLGATVEVVRQGLDPSEAPLDYTSIMVSLAAFGVMMVAAFMIGSTVRGAARSAKRELLALTDTKPEAVQAVVGLGKEEIQRSMENMVFWPVNYLRAGQFFGLVLLGVFCIFFYRLGVILLGLVLLRIFWEVVKYLWGESAQASSDGAGNGQVPGQSQH